MKANALSLLAIFEQKLRLEVPLFQRQYVWSQDEQWMPLWEDIERKFTEYLEGRKDAPVHFLGAMVLDQKQTPITHVAKRQVIDGQQRLTTLQIFLSAFRDFCRQQSCDELARECEAFTLNKGMMAEPDVDRFKVWPTLLDRAQFKDVIGAGSRKALEEKHPLVRRKYHRKPDPRPRMVEAYLYFHNQLEQYFLGTTAEPAIAGSEPLAARLEECFQALRNALQVVVIDLEAGDDAQVIFETLNARGEPLLPADLLRNYIFLRAARQGEAQEALYEEYWRRFDDEFWREQVGQGRLLRPRSDLFLQHFLASRQTVDIPVKHLFEEYKFWITRQSPFATVRDELATLARQGDDFRRILQPAKEDVLFPLMTFLDAFDIRTAYPLLLHLLDVRTSDDEWRKIAGWLESYLLRRAICGYTTKNYNRVFLTLTRTLRRDGVSAESIRKHLTDLSGESTGWPSDDEFRRAWMTRPVYQALLQPRVVYVLRRLSDAFLGSKTEKISIEGELSIEHLLPQRWVAEWPLADGTKGMTDEELENADELEPGAKRTRARNEVLHTFGNLTILTQQLNTSVSNSAWKVKKPALLQASLLPINQQLYSFDKWDESTIEIRAQALFNAALRLWSKPTGS